MNGLYILMPFLHKTLYVSKGDQVFYPQIPEFFLVFFSTIHTGCVAPESSYALS